ncbi:MAG TPA: BrnT family toxin [Terracidiphilus sp.]|nr:BrnT family toxin [Terracidiphilus sp.]
MAARDPLSECMGFDWDESNALKNWEKHKVTPEEAEGIFFGEPLAVRSDAAHSSSERRYSALGQTGSGRLLYVAFTIRRKLIRVISARDMNRKESAEYRRHEKSS